MTRPPAAVVVVAGLPGAGKTTLVASEPRALDSDALREAWAQRLPGVPYALWRPLLHAWHWIAIWRALKRPERVILVRPFTAGWLRRAVLRRARRHHPAVHLVVVDATPAQARAGQRARGRTVRERAMRRHERRWARANFGLEPWTTVTRVPRRSANSQPAFGRFARGELSMDAHPPTKGEGSMLSTVHRSAVTVVALGALGLGGSAIAGAADNTASSGTKSQTRPQREALSSSVAAKVKAAALENGRGEAALTGSTKDKVEAAVLAKYAGAKIVRTETNRDSTAPYESHITTSAGKELEVLVSKDFKVVDAREHPARP